jgi:uncharacterized phage protein (TIGR01671 family)
MKNDMKKQQTIVNDRHRFKFYDKSIGFMGEVKSMSVLDNWAMVRFSYANEETPDDEVNLSDGILLQCTGLKDKNAELIYEGDIYQWDWDVNLKNNVVFVSGCFGHLNKLGTYGDYFVAINKARASRMKVIGNIYENPELIKK